VSLVAAARQRGVDVSCETCPHYLSLTEDDLEALGALAKCAPPLRPRAEQAGLWQQLLDGSLPMVASDHSPAPASMKTGGDFFQIWGGISGCQSTLQLLLTDGYARRKLPLETIAAVTSEFVARRFGLAPQKGQLEVGADADLALVDLRRSFTLEPGDLRYRHRHSPYVGRTLCGRIERTLVRGTTVFLNGQIVAAPIGRLIDPDERGLGRAAPSAKPDPE
jgi:allantoinase